MTDLQEPPKVPDWDLIQARYVQGVGPTELSKMFGVKADTISVRATRKGWQRLKQKASVTSQSVTITTESKQDESPKLTAQSERTRKALADVLVRSAEKLASMPIHTPSTALRVNQDAESMVRNAKTVFGWSEGQSSPAVRISIMDSAVVIQEQAGQALSEVPEVKQLPPASQ